MSKYLLNKFLFTVDRDPELVERYREDPRGTVTWSCARSAARSSSVNDSHVVRSAGVQLRTVLAISASHHATVPAGSSR